MDKSVVSAVDEIVLNSVVPDLTILLDVDLETSNSRKGQREYSDTFDEEVADFHQRVRQDYLAQAKERPDKFFVVDGRGGVEEIHQKVFNKVVSLLNRHAELQ